MTFDKWLAEGRRLEAKVDQTREAHEEACGDFTEFLKTSVGFPLEEIARGGRLPSIVTLVENIYHNFLLQKEGE